MKRAARVDANHGDAVMKLRSRFDKIIGVAGRSQRPTTPHHNPANGGRAAWLIPILLGRARTAANRSRTGGSSDTALRPVWPQATARRCVARRTRTGETFRRWSAPNAVASLRTVTKLAGSALMVAMRRAAAESCALVACLRLNARTAAPKRGAAGRTAMRVGRRRMLTGASYAGSVSVRFAGDKSGLHCGCVRRAGSRGGSFGQPERLNACYAARRLASVIANIATPAGR